MRRAELEHLIRAAAAITNEYEIVVIGSQSILGSVPAPPPELMQSMEADCYPMRRPELADLIDGAIGELSPFHERFGYYAQGVGPETAVLPDGWQERLVKLQNEQTDLKLGWCLEPHDLAAAKLVAGRSVRKYTDEAQVAKKAQAAGFQDIFDQKLITLTKMESLMGKETFNEVLGSLVVKPQGKPTLVPESDKRPALNETIEFTNLEEKDNG